MAGNLWTLLLLFTLKIEEYTSVEDKRCTWNENIFFMRRSHCNIRHDDSIPLVVNCFNAIDIEIPKCFKTSAWYDWLSINITIKVKEPWSELFIAGRKKNDFKFSNLILEEGNLTSIPNAMFNLHYLKEIHITNNKITKVNLNFFSPKSGVTPLRKINLSNNKISMIDSDNRYGLNGIEDINLSHNLIKDLPKYVFKLFISLQHLNLAHNKMNKTDIYSFEGLQKLITLDLSHNQRTKLGVSVTRLLKLEELSISNNDFKELHSVNFVTLTNLKKLDASFNSIRDIEDDCFQGLSKLEYLDLQHNNIEVLNFVHSNNFNILHLKEIYLNNNNIKHVSAETIFHLRSLRIVNLANNTILKLESNVFNSLSSFVNLDLSSNTNLEIVGNPFQNFKNITKLSLQNVKLDLIFQVSKVSIEHFEAQTNGVTNLNKMQIYNINELKTLNLSMNELTFIDGNTFKVIPTLVSLDLSRNKIKYIQPSSFIYLEKLSFLNLSENRLQTISYGVFIGPTALKYVDLSSNTLQSFDINLLPAVETLYLDNNEITDLNFKGIFHTNASKLSVGQNLLSCEVLAKLTTTNESSKFDQIVTAKLPVYSSENVNGISCVNKVVETAKLNTVNSNYKSLIALLKTAVEKISKTEKSLEVLTESVAKLSSLMENVAIDVKV